jgi:hypothetical protein
MSPRLSRRWFVPTGRVLRHGPAERRVVQRRARIERWPNRGVRAFLPHLASIGTTANDFLWYFWRPLRVITTTANLTERKDHA